MIQSVQRIVERIGSVIGERPFSCGFLAGLAAACAVLVFLFLLCLVFRSRKLRFIEVPSEGGTLRIDAKAVRGAVLAVAANFPAFEVRKVVLYGKQKAARLDIAADFTGGDADRGNWGESREKAPLHDRGAHRADQTFDAAPSQRGDPDV